MNNRPASGRNVPGAVSHSLPRQAASRLHTHSSSIGSLASANRIDRRRKSSSANTSVATAVRLGLLAEQHMHDASALNIKSGRRTAAKSGSAATAYASSLPASNGFEKPRSEASASSAIADVASALEPLLETTADLKARNRRASEGSGLLKAAEAKRQANGELKCETCGKSYKHSSCLHKHLWEHTPEWAITSKLLISKHQQVQLLEAASVLMQITQDAVESDVSSPDASSSDLQSDIVSSKDDSPPPGHIADHSDEAGAALVGKKRYSGNSSTYSQSYQSSVFSDARHLNAHSRQMSSDNRPNTAGTSAASYSDEDKEEMSAAFNLLSCSLSNGTPIAGPVTNTEHIPPVPPLPSKYLGKSPDHLSGSTITGTSLAPNSFVRGSQRDDVSMDEDDEPGTEHTLHQQSALDAAYADEEVGMFGRMEE